MAAKLPAFYRRSLVRFEGIGVDDADLRGELLTVFHQFRHNGDGWVPTSDVNVKNGVASRSAIGSVCQQLADAGLIVWRPLRGNLEGFIIGNARITGHGVDVVAGRARPSIAVHLGDAASEQPEASQVTERAQSTTPCPPEKAPDIFTLKPGFMGMSIDLKEAWRWLNRWWRSVRG